MLCSLCLLFDKTPAVYLSISSWEDENPGQPELSDTAEMLDDLIREGYLSLTDLDLSNSHTANHSR